MTPEDYETTIATLRATLASEKARADRLHEGIVRENERLKELHAVVAEVQSQRNAWAARNSQASDKIAALVRERNALWRLQQTATRFVSKRKTGLTDADWADIETDLEALRGRPPP